jgi:hypothetical protein
MSHIAGYCQTIEESWMPEKSEYEKQMARVEELMEQIVDQTTIAEIAAATRRAETASRLRSPRD